MTRLHAQSVTLAYGKSEAVVRDVTLRVRDGAVTALIGPNGCGKSSLLRAMARLMHPREGVVLLDGVAVHRQPTRDVAKRLGLLAQHIATPGGIIVEDLVRRGRYPHQRFLEGFSKQDAMAVECALEFVGLHELRHCVVDELSGGQRQLAWLAMALAQDTPILLLDEPTTYLDVAHQREILHLVRRLNRADGRTILLVLHDINQAIQVSDYIVAVRNGSVIAEGRPGDLITPELLESLYGIPCDVLEHPVGGFPVVVPRSRVLQLNLQREPRRPGRAGALRAEGLSVGYGDRPVVTDVSMSLPAGAITAVVGPNGSGKSTLLRAFARLLTPLQGITFLDGAPVLGIRPRAFAQKVAVLLQEASTPSDLPVEDLVMIGRHPYQRWYCQWSRRDQAAVDRALAAVGVEELRRRPLGTLSGGQRQRVYLAMALAQDTDVLLLDEPTTFLDIAHQVEVLDLVWQLNRVEGKTVVMVLHDLGQAARYADFIVVMKDGRVVAIGHPEEVITETLVRKVFGVDSRVVPDPVTGRPLVLPPLIH